MYNYETVKGTLWNIEANWKRIDKRIARKLFNEGKTIVLCPHKLHPFGHYGLGIPVSKAFVGYNETSFDKVVNAAEFYNCNNETGYYLSYWMPVNNEGDYSKVYDI